MTDMLTQIQIETRYFCNLRCDFCPNSIKEPTGHYMPMPLFEKILADMKDIGFRNRITLYLRNEPLADERILEMIEYTRKMFPDNRINISTNGVLLTENIMFKLFQAGLTDMDISCYTDDMFLKWSKFSSNSIAVHDIVDSPGWLNNRGGYIKAGRDEVGVGFCGRPFIQLYITSEGKCVLCCNDFMEDVVMGNLDTQTITEVWESDIYREYRNKQTTNKRAELKLCSTCNYEGF